MDGTRICSLQYREKREMEMGKSAKRTESMFFLAKDRKMTWLTGLPLSAINAS
jgi:hypothetical protein